MKCKILKLSLKIIWNWNALFWTLRGIEWVASGECLDGLYTWRRAISCRLKKQVYHWKKWTVVLFWQKHMTGTWRHMTRTWRGTASTWWGHGGDTWNTHDEHMTGTWRHMKLTRWAHDGLAMPPPAGAIPTHPQCPVRVPQWRINRPFYSLFTSCYLPQLSMCIHIPSCSRHAPFMSFYVPLVSLRMPFHASLILLEISVISLDVPSCSLDICKCSIDLSSYVLFMFP